MPRLWERHLLNCAVLSEVIPRASGSCDVGCGAGLPGIPLALVRPDLQITLLEPLLRRYDFLTEVVERLGLDHVTVVRGRAEEGLVRRALPVHVVTARAVAPLDRLAGWGVPLLRPGGRLLALKGETAAAESGSGPVRAEPAPARRALRGAAVRRRRGAIRRPAVVAVTRGTVRSSCQREATRRARPVTSTIPVRRPSPIGLAH